MPKVKYLGYATTLTLPGHKDAIKPGDTVTIEQRVLDDLLVRGHTFEGATVEVVRLPEPHEVPDFEPVASDGLDRASALRRLQSAGGTQVVALADAEPQQTNVVPELESEAAEPKRAKGK